MKKKTILLIEDEQLQIEVMLRALRKEYNTLLATDGREGLNMARSENPDLIILDVFLPKMKGTEVLKKLKSDEDTKDIPVIVMTHLEDEEVYKQVKETSNREPLVKKDYTVEEIIKKIEDRLNSDG